MTITIDLPAEVQEWLTRKLQTGQFSSPAELVKSRLCQDWLEEKIEEALQEPAQPLTHADWHQARQRLRQG